MTNLNPAAAPPPRPGRFLGLRLGGSRYGIPVTQVREIIVMCPVTEVPRMPAHIRGVINLRGTVVPVIGLRERFGMQALEDEARACIIVLQPLGSARPGRNSAASSTCSTSVASLRATAWCTRCSTSHISSTLN
jgi:chemotaxis signal transduction protein